MRLNQIFRFVIPLFLTLTIVLGIFFWLRFGMGFVIGFVASFVSSILTTLLFTYLVWRPVRLHLTQHLIVERNGVLIDSRMRGGLVLVRRFTDLPIPVDLQVRSGDLHDLQTITIDAAPLTVSVSYIWRVRNPYLYASTPRNFESVLSLLVSSAVKNQINGFPFRAALGSRLAIAAATTLDLQRNVLLRHWGIHLVQLDLMEMKLPQVYQEVMTRELVANLVAPAVIREGENMAHAFDMMQTIVGNDARLLQVLETVRKTFGKS